jgi:hypothetical protein
MASAEIRSVKKYDRSISGAGVGVTATLPPMADTELLVFSGMIPMPRTRTMKDPACMPVELSVDGEGPDCARAPKAIMTPAIAKGTSFDIDIMIILLVGQAQDNEHCSKNLDLAQPRNTAPKPFFF